MQNYVQSNQNHQPSPYEVVTHFFNYFVKCYLLLILIDNRLFLK